MYARTPAKVQPAMCWVRAGQRSMANMPTVNTTLIVTSPQRTSGNTYPRSDQGQNSCSSQSVNVAVPDTTRSAGNWLSAAGLDRAIAMLERAVELLDEIRAQIDVADEARRAAFTRALSAPARALRYLYRNSGQEESARRVTLEWSLE